MNYKNSGCTKSTEIFLQTGELVKHFHGLYVKRAEKNITRLVEVAE
jgi:hypothetical protein